MIEPSSGLWELNRAYFDEDDLLIVLTGRLLEARTDTGEEFGEQCLGTCLRHPAAPDPQADVTALFREADHLAIGWDRDGVSIIVTR